MGKSKMELPELCDEISHLTALLSLISKRLPDLERTNEKPTSPIPASEPITNDGVGINDEEEAHIDEVEFESDLTVDEEAAADAALKQRALDRLAEVLSRFKTMPTQAGRRDAQHVASVALIEDFECG